MIIDVARCLVNKSILVCIVCFIPSLVHAQIGGRHSFDFLNVPDNARLAALGGVNVSLPDRELNFFYSNPALISDSLTGWGSAGYQFYLAGIGLSTFSYAHPFKKIGTLSMGVRHMGYGTIEGYDPTGVYTGDFKAGETALVVSKSHQLSHFRFGVNLKAVFSSIAGYRASAMLIDLGGVFIHPEQQLYAGLVIRNLGFLLREYSPTSQSTLPFDVQVGLTFKPEDMPLRFSITAYHLTRADIAYDDPNDENEERGILDGVLRHFNFGAEILLHRNFNVLFGYNYLIHKELRLERAGGGSGVCLGVSGRIKSFEFTFSRNSYIVGTAGYTFTLTTDIKKMMTRR